MPRIKHKILIEKKEIANMLEITGGEGWHEIETQVSSQLFREIDLRRNVLPLVEDGQYRVSFYIRDDELQDIETSIQTRACSLAVPVHLCKELVRHYRSLDMSDEERYIQLLRSLNRLHPKLATNRMRNYTLRLFESTAESRYLIECDSMCKYHNIKMSVKDSKITLTIPTKMTILPLISTASKHCGYKDHLKRIKRRALADYHLDLSFHYKRKDFNTKSYDGKYVYYGEIHNTNSNLSLIVQRNLDDKDLYKRSLEFLVSSALLDQTKLEVDEKLEYSYKMKHKFKANYEKLVDLCSLFEIDFKQTSPTLISMTMHKKIAKPILTKKIAMREFIKSLKIDDILATIAENDDSLTITLDTNYHTIEELSSTLMELLNNRRYFTLDSSQVIEHITVVTTASNGEGITYEIDEIDEIKHIMNILKKSSS